MTPASSKFGGRRTMPALRRGLHEDAGQALVELALVIPLLTLILVGAAEVGRIAYAAIEVNNAARAGVAYAAQTHATATASDPTNMSYITLAATQEAPDVTGMTVTASDSCICSDGTSITCTTALTSCLSPARNIETVQVNTTATIDTAFHFPGIPNSITLNGQAIMTTENP